MQRLLSEGIRLGKTNPTSLQALLYLTCDAEASDQSRLHRTKMCHQGAGVWVKGTQDTGLFGRESQGVQVQWWGWAKGSPCWPSRFVCSHCSNSPEQQPWPHVGLIYLYVFSHVTAARVRWAVSPFKKLHRAALDRGLAQSGSSIFKDWGREGRRQRRPNCFVAYTAVSPE